MKEKPSNTPAETRHRSQLVKSWDTRLAHHECESCLHVVALQRLSRVRPTSHTMTAGIGSSPHDREVDAHLCIHVH